jgi:hypothetical protein
LDWEQYLPALRFSYNTSYHSTIATTPFELLYGMKARTPSLPGQDIQRKFYGESFASERLQILQKAREIAKQHIEDKQTEYKFQHDKKAKAHDFSMGQQVWYAQTEFLGKNKKLAPKFIGPAQIIDINDAVAKLKLLNGKIKKLNVNKLKHFFPGEEVESDNEEESNSTEDPGELINFDPTTQRPLTRPWSKLIKSDAISALLDTTDAASADEIWYKLNGIGYKLYHLNLDFNQLTSQELDFWKSFRQEDIFEWLSGSPIHPPDYSEYIRIRTRGDLPNQPQLQPEPQPGPADPNPAPQPGPAPAAGFSPKKLGRPPGSKNKAKDPFTRAAHYASKRITRATAKLLSPPTNKRVFEPFP